MYPVGVLLAGGQARRMGGGDKSLRLLDGRPMLSYVVDTLRPQLTHLVLNANGDPARFSSWGLPMVADCITGNPGPMAGILAGMAWAAENVPDATDVLSVPTDTPFLPCDLARRLMDARQAEKADIAVAASGDYVHFATALWRVQMAADLQRKLTEEGLRRIEDFQRAYRVVVVKYDTAGGDPFLNINSPEDLVAAETRLLR